MKKYNPVGIDIIGAATNLGFLKGSDFGPYQLMIGDKEVISCVEDTLIDVRCGQIVRAPRQGSLIGRLEYFSNNLAHAVNKTLCERRLPIVVGGDHSCAIGTWAGVKRFYRPDRLGLIWFDAHMDAHTRETSSSGNYHGMPLAILLGHGDERLVKLGNETPMLDPKRVCLIGVRNYEAKEKELLDSLDVKYFTADEVRSEGIRKVMDQAIVIATGNRNSYYGISIDLDVLDPSRMISVNTPEPNGLTVPELMEATRGLRYDNALIAMEIAEFNPWPPSGALGEAYNDGKVIRDLLINVGIPKDENNK